MGNRRVRHPPGIADVSVRSAPACDALSDRFRPVRATSQLDHEKSAKSGTKRHSPKHPHFQIWEQEAGSSSLPTPTHRRVRSPLQNFCEMADRGRSRQHLSALSIDLLEVWVYGRLMSVASPDLAPLFRSAQQSAAACRDLPRGAGFWGRVGPSARNRAVDRRSGRWAGSRNRA